MSRVDKLLPCPFCGGEAEIEREGTGRQSCIVSCLNCGCHLESGETFNSGSRWNTRVNVLKVGDFLKDGIQRAQAHGDSVAMHEFLVFMNPRYRGPNWRWGDFKKHVIQAADVTVWQNFSDEEWKAWESEIRASTKTSASYAADRVLQTSGLMDWWSYAVDEAQKKSDEGNSES